MNKYKCRRCGVTTIIPDGVMPENFLKQLRHYEFCLDCFKESVEP